MSSQPLPERPSLEQLKKRAREQQRSSGEPLHAAQLSLARDYGFANWARLKQHVAAIEERTWTPPDARTLDELLDSGARDLAAVAAAGDPTAVEALLAAGAAVDASCGPFGWTPLMYLAYSRRDVGETATLTTARRLIAAGADPNEGRYFRGYPTPFTVLTGVFGGGEDGGPAHPHAVALARMLLDAGADPNDAQTVYNRQFELDDTAFELLFEYGLGRGDGGIWPERLPDLTPTPNELVRKLLAWAIVHDQRARVAMLADHGVDLVAPLPGTAATPMREALRNGHRELALLLARLGDQVLTSPDRFGPWSAATAKENAIETFVGAALAGDAATVDATATDIVAAARAARPGLVVWAASVGHDDAVELVTSAGFDVNAFGRGDVPVEQPWQSALHTAVERGDADLVARLLRLGARADVRDARFDATPADWAQHCGHDHLLALLDAG